MSGCNHWNDRGSSLPEKFDRALEAQLPAVLEAAREAEIKANAVPLWQRITAKNPAAGSFAAAGSSNGAAGSNVASVAEDGADADADAGGGGAGFKFGF